MDGGLLLWTALVQSLQAYKFLGFSLMCETLPPELGVVQQRSVRADALVRQDNTDFITMTVSSSYLVGLQAEYRPLPCILKSTDMLQSHHA